jgi:hypothetical protein
VLVLNVNVDLQDVCYNSWQAMKSLPCMCCVSCCCSLLLFGANDPFVDVKNPQAWLESKRTTMRLVTATAKVRLESMVLEHAHIRKQT